MWWPDLFFCLWSEQKTTKLNVVLCSEQAVWLVHILTVSLIQIQNCSHWRIVMWRTQRWVFLKHKFPKLRRGCLWSFFYSETGNRFDAALNPAKYRLYMLWDQMCQNSFHFHWTFSSSTFKSGMKELFLTWYFMGTRCMLASAETVGMKTSGKRPDLQHSIFVSWCWSGFNLTEFLLNFALNGVNRTNIDGQIK